MYDNNASVSTASTATVESQDVEDNMKIEKLEVHTHTLKFTILFYIRNNVSFCRAMESRKLISRICKKLDSSLCRL